MRNLDAKVRDILAASALTTQLANGADSILPTVVGGVYVEPAKDTPTPFIVINLGEEPMIAAPTLRSAFFDITVYDGIGSDGVDYYYARINNIMAAIEAALTVNAAITLDNRRVYSFNTLYCFHTTAPERDQDMDKRLRIMRWSIDCA